MLAFLLTLGTAIWRRRLSWRDRLDPLVLTGLALGLIVVALATAAADTRYTVPSLPLAMLGAGLALRRRPPTEPNPGLESGTESSTGAAATPTTPDPAPTYA
jgi:hypothetical protein